tara:strand:+ start:11013 stop:11951 length:939 start_codon:yes stop_codon:yes gene_type:complete
MKIKINSEFAHELVLAIPYAYWLHKQGQLESVTTSKGMKPFYYFCDNVIEKFDFRTLDHETSGLKELPNDWIHHNAFGATGKYLHDMTQEEQDNVNGVLDYRQWIPPDYKHTFNDVKFIDRPYIVVNNNFNIESGNDISKSMRYFDIKSLYEIFNILTEKGYTIIYKRPDNTEFAPDQNEKSTIEQKLTLKANVHEIGEMTDYELCEYYDNIENLNSLKEKYSEYSYNELQLRIFANAKGFITPNGGGGILCGYFDVPVVMHVPSGKELRTNYLTNKESYYNKLSNNKLYPVIDPNNESNYKKLFDKIKEVF